MTKRHQTEIEKLRRGLEEEKRNEVAAAKIQLTKSLEAKTAAVLQSSLKAVFTVEGESAQAISQGVFVSESGSSSRMNLNLGSVHPPINGFHFLARLDISQPYSLTVATVNANNERFECCQYYDSNSHQSCPHGQTL